MGFFSLIRYFQNERHNGNLHGTIQFTSQLFPATVLLSEHQTLPDGEVATLRVYLFNAVKSVVVARDDDILTKQEVQELR